MYPLSLIYLVETSKGASFGPLFSFVFTTMVSIGLAGAHVQPVLEIFFEPEPVGEPAASAVAREPRRGATQLLL